MKPDGGRAGSLELTAASTVEMLFANQKRLADKSVSRKTEKTAVGSTVSWRGGVNESQRLKCVYTGLSTTPVVYIRPACSQGGKKGESKKGSRHQREVGGGDAQPTEQVTQTTARQTAAPRRETGRQGYRLEGENRGLSRWNIAGRGCRQERSANDQRKSAPATFRGKTVT